MRLPWIAAAAAVVLLGGACSLADLDGLAGGDATDGGSELTPAEAGPFFDAQGDAADAAGDATTADAACVNLLLNGGFEEQTLCKPWTNYGGPATDGTPARTGVNACRMCTSGADQCSRRSAWPHVRAR